MRTWCEPDTAAVPAANIFANVIDIGVGSCPCRHPFHDYYNGRKNFSVNMAQGCFKTKGSDPPVCGVHKVRLIEIRVPIDSNAPQLGVISCLKCPVRDVIVLDEK